MTKPIKQEFNAQTNETIEREMNDAEYTQYLIDKADWEIEQAAREAALAEETAAAEAKKAAKAEALAALGLSQEIINLLAE
jgi:hypothetical protein